ncbi:MAG: chromosomal replication initiation ATPase DnaA [Alphaproteobacteria bacterium]
MEQLALSLPFYTSYDPADFVISECNFIAFERIQQKTIPASHMLGLIGAENTGKTHLTSVFHSLYPTATRLCNETLKTYDLLNLSAHSFIIDDADIIRDEVAFFHLINIVRQRKGILFFTAKTAPSQWRIRLPDLKSRLCSAELVYLQNIDAMLHRNILEKLFSDRQININTDIIDYTLDFIKPDIHNFKQFVACFDQLLLNHRRTPSKSFVIKVLFEKPLLMNEAAQHKFLGKKI